MARSFKNYQLNLNESQIRLREIGQLIKPYKTSFTWLKSLSFISTSFDDEFNNEIEVLFHKFSPNSNIYEVEFMVNKNSMEAFNTDLTHFFHIISTVIHTLNDFIEKFNPSQLLVEGMDKLGKEGQKNKIWKQYVKVNLKAEEYTIGDSKDGFMIQKIRK